MSEFKLEEWEVPPGVNGAGAADAEPPLTCGPLRWKGGMTTFTLKLAPVSLNSATCLIFFRANNSEKNYVIVSSGAICELSLFPADISQDDMKAALEEAIKGTRSSFGRLFYVQDEVCIVREKVACWVVPSDQMVIFRVPFNPMAGPSSRMFSWLQQEWKRLNSEVRFAWSWKRFSLDEKHEFFCEHVDCWREVHAMMRWVAQLEGLPDGTRWWLDFVELPDLPAVEKRLLLWGEIVEMHYSWLFNWPPESAPLCLLDYFECAVCHINIYGAATSTHERLEARLKLREWLERNAPERMEGLFPHNGNVGL